MKPEHADFPQIDWGKMKMWQIWDPVPWWILDRDKLQQILVAQLDYKLDIMHREMEQMQKIRDIVGGK